MLPNEIAQIECSRSFLLFCQYLLPCQAHSPPPYPSSPSDVSRGDELFSSSHLPTHLPARWFISYTTAAYQVVTLTKQQAHPRTPSGCGCLVCLCTLGTASTVSTTCLLDIQAQLQVTSISISQYFNPLP
ncbi:hypothetical protein Cob_v010320 [Colletotrichum orbiculare MAFF 240422]|uniref:Uncharacterized protein n=1 Tax=Colletotrichum orbiculare (strain 104-T / ATCC 96160 / CBS 514.97 / LARS 414 / MAFF 240422) TaxID=1213857 RepID=A0A484FEJ5_COLOR|nr:hypothetical protein Cob_v010320 [Colletotrichum orbiculare MAFF 240422]